MLPGETRPVREGAGVEQPPWNPGDPRHPPREEGGRSEGAGHLEMEDKSHKTSHGGRMQRRPVETASEGVSVNSSSFPRKTHRLFPGSTCATSSPAAVAQWLRVNL